MDDEKLALHALNMRKNVLRMAFECGTSAHLGGALSIIDALAVLYGRVMNASDLTLPRERRDKFILSKGHGALGLYAALFEFGVISMEKLKTFQKDGSDLIAHPVMNESLGIEASTGSLGQGISMAVGLALAAKRRGYPYQTYALLGNGECNEGSVWEAFMSAVNFQLENLTVIIDNNHLQSDGESRFIMDVSEKYPAMLHSLGFQTVEADGHDMEALVRAFELSHEAEKPKAVILDTVKGKGVSFMENDNAWHHSRLTKAQYEAAIEELEAG